jgi:hypothetical protein
VDVLEHWLCTNCGTIDGARAGMVCHGPRFTGICMALGETVVEISPGAVKRLQGAVEALRALDADLSLLESGADQPGTVGSEWVRERLRPIIAAVGGQ